MAPPGAPGLVRRGIVPAAVAERLRRHYGEPPPSAPPVRALAVCAALGATLIGLGVILLLAQDAQIRRARSSATSGRLATARRCASAASPRIRPN